MNQASQITDNDIRNYLGHDGDNCVVRIKREGSVWRYGSSDPFDRSKDYWHFIGMSIEIKDEIAEMNRHNQ